MGSSMRESKGRAILVLAVSMFATLALFVASASAAKQVVDYFGNSSGSGSLGGEFSGPRSIAVNTSGAGPADAGDIYVVDEFNNRIQRFDEDGSFISAWGADVIQAGKSGDQAGTNPFEVCTVAADCKEGAGSGGNGATSGNGSFDNPQSVAVDGDTGNVYVSDRDNFRINEYTGDGTFIRAFGFDVDATEAATGYEVCPAANICKTGIAGAGAGQIGETFSDGLGIAVSPADGNASSGTLFLADSQNRRVNTYDLDGQSPASFGSEVEFGESQPRRLAVDSRGIVYASDSNNGAEIDRYDSEDANGAGVGFLAPIAMPPLLEGPSESATSGLAVDPDSDGGGTDEDVLYVLRGSWSSGSVVQQFGPVNDPGLSAAPTATDDTHGAGAGFETFATQGLGLDDTGGRLFISSNSNIPGATGFPHRVYVLDDPVAPAASIDPVATFDAHSATFSGSVDPNGALTTYRFEYVDDAEFQANDFANASRVPISDVAVGKGDAPVAVQQQIATGLIAGTLYHVRLVAKPQFDAATTIAGPVTFTTEDSAPSIDGSAATVGTDEATLRGTIDPENEAVSDYHFEWGPTSAYGDTTGAGNLPTGKGPVAVSAVLNGLVPGATYHYRLVATNGTGTTPGPDGTFTTLFGPPQFPDRAYELVSPYPTGGDPVLLQGSFVSVSEDGDRVHFGNLLKPFRGSKLAPPPDQLHYDRAFWRYGSVRGPNGWQTEEYGLAQGAPGAGVSADGTRYLFTTEAGEFDSRLDPDDHGGVGTPGGHPDNTEVYERQPDGSLVWISRDPRIPVGTPQADPGGASLFGLNSLGMAHMSVDGSTVVFRSQRQLDDADTTDFSQVGLLAGSTYKWSGGQLHFIGVRPDGSVPERGSFLGDDVEDSALQQTVSRDGSRVLFGAQRTDSGPFGTNRTLYIQTDGEPTAEAVKETGVPALPEAQPFDVTYRGASADLSRAFFTTSSRLTSNSGAAATSGGSADLYVYDIDADKVRDLTPRLDGIDDSTIDPATADQGGALGLVANSEDGKRAYFVADARYDVAPNPEGQLPSPEGRNLYLAELDGIDDPIKLRFVAALGAGDASVWQAQLVALEEKTSSASPDGSVLGFGSTEPLTGQALGGARQLFVYDAEADTLECASCPGDGSLPAGEVNPLVSTLGFPVAWQGRHSYKRWISTDGTVFFHTATQLVDDDTNLVSDVYEYRSGQLRLVSSGTGTTSVLEDISRDGNTVIFNTLDALVPKDEEPGVPKLYAARVGGGFPFVPKPAPCDLGAGACEGAGSKAPQQPGAGSAAFEGAGDPKPKKAAKRCPKSKRKVRRKGKARCAPANTRKHKRDAKNDRRANR